MRIRAIVALCCANATAPPTSTSPKTAKKTLLVPLNNPDIVVSFENDYLAQKDSSQLVNQLCRTSKSCALFELEIGQEA
jgi:hypothetical protein